MIGSVWTVKPPPGTPINWQHPLAQGLVGCWPFNEGAGPIAYNVADLGSANNAVFQSGSASPTWVSGPCGSAIHTLGSSSQYADCGVLSALNGAKQASILMLCQGDSSSAVMSFGRCSTNNYRFYLLQYSTGNMYVVGEYGTGANLGYCACSIQNNTCAVGVFDSSQSTQANGLRLYLNGVLQSLGFDGTWTQGTGLATRSDPVRIGRDESNTVYSTGRFDLGMIWTRALSAQEIASVTANPWQLFAPPAFDWLLHGAAGGGSVSVNVGAVLASGYIGAGGLSLITRSAAVLGTGYAGGITAGPTPATTAVAATAYAGSNAETLIMGPSSVAATGFAGGTSETLAVNSTAVLATAYAPATGVSVIIAAPAPFATAFAGGTSVTLGGTVIVSAAAVSATAFAGGTTEKLTIAVPAVHATTYTGSISVGAGIVPLWLPYTFSTTLMTSALDATDAFAIDPGQTKILTSALDTTDAFGIDPGQTVKLPAAEDTSDPFGIDPGQTTLIITGLDTGP